MVEAYIDESGIHEGARVCVVAGYYGSRDVWSAFEACWNSVLRHSQVEQFHSVQFWGKDKHGNRVGPYSAWDDSRANDFLEQLVKLVESSEIHPFASGIVVNEWKRFPLESRQWLTGAVWNGNRFKSKGAPNKPYFLPFQGCVLEPATMQTGVVDYYFGLDKSFSRHARILYEKIKNLEELPWRERLGKIEFPLSKDTPGLQAADLLTHSFYKHCKGRLGKDSSVPELLKRLTARERVKQKYWFIRTADLERMVEIAQRRYDARMRALHEPTNCAACRSVQIQHQLRQSSAHSADTSHRAVGTKSHTVFRYGQCIESELGNCVPWRLGGERLPVFDPRKGEN